jgi:2-dehydro-3-deoxygluconokinase
VVKNGAGPVTYLSPTATGSVTPPSLDRIVDTTSAGDSFNAAFLAGYGGVLGLEACIAAATRIATQVICQKGALVPLDLRDWAPFSPPAHATEAQP